MSGARKVLVVEDDPDIRDTLGLVLEAEGYQVVGAENGQEGLARLRSGPRPCLILLDLMMPVMNGCQFRAEQARDPALADIPVVVISADARATQKAARLGVAACLTKPIDFDELLRMLGRHC